MTRKFLKYLTLAALLLVGPAREAAAQVQDSLSLPQRDSLIHQRRDSLARQVPDSLRFFRDSLDFALDSVLTSRDSLLLARMRADSIAAARRDSLELLNKSSLEVPAFSTAKDSIITDFSGGKRMIYYYGGATVTYQNMKLTADYIEYDMNTNTVFARGQKDTLTGEWTGLPEMTEGSQTYKMDNVHYNFTTRKARITNMVTKEAEGILQGKKIKMMPDKSINMRDGVYTVCDLEHPHYYLKLTMAKVITKPSQKTVFGPAWPVIADVPAFPIILPFGFVPKKPSRATGLLMPTFGEEQARGFYIRDAGMYFVFGDYFDLSVTGDYYTLGSWALDINSRYKVNYKFNGSFAITYSNDQAGEVGSTDFVQSRNFGLRWSHSQDAKAHPGTSFSASVNFSSPSNNRYNARSVSDAQQNQINSSISYSHNWNGKFNLSVNALHNQNSRDSSYSFTLPNITFSVTRFYPFKQKTRVGKEKFYEKISFGYNTSLQNRISFKLRDMQDFVMEDGQHVLAEDANGNVYRMKQLGDSLGVKALEKLTNGMTHSFQIGLPSFTLFKYINVNPSINYGMNWMFSSGSQTLVDEQNEDGTPLLVKDKEGNDVVAKKVVTDPGRAFNAFGITHTYSGSMSLSTRIYGMFNFGKHRRVQAIRHVITPSVSLSFSPEKGTGFNGWRQLDAYYDKRGSYHQEAWYNIYSISGNHNTASPPGRGKTGTMSVSFGNNLEAKVRDLRDTTGTGSKKVKLLDQLNINTNYNFLADSLRMGNISISASTHLFNKINLSGNMSFDPYAINEQGKKINKFNVVATGVPARLTNASLSASFSLSGKGATDGNDGRRGPDGKGGGGGVTMDATSYQRIYYHPVTGEYIPGGYLYYMNTNAPWSINVSYSFNYSKSYSYQSTTKQLIENKRFTQTLNLSGNIKLTPRMSIQATSGFDIMAMRFTTTQISATYDLHCFNIALSWVPMGQWKSYSFRIAANASALADLLRFKKSDSYMDNMLK